MKRLSTIFLCILALLLVSDKAIAKGSWIGRWEAIYPDSVSNNSSCFLCHGTSTSNLNGYGLEVKIEIDRGSNIDAAIQNVEEIDSDIDPDGLVNIQEINADAQPGWTEGPNNSIYRMDGTTLLTNQDAPTDIQGILDPSAGNQAPMVKANGPYSGNVGDPVSFSSTGSFDGDGIIESYLWSFGDNTTSTELNPTHTYSDAGTYTVVLTVTDDQGAASSDTSTAVIVVPPVNEPDIDLSYGSLNFSQVEVGNPQSLTTEVKNVGTQKLDVTGISLCGGTSTEYSWSPETFSLDPGAGLTLTVFYNPVDQNSDIGCLKIDSNDPDENSVLLDLAGSGFIPQSEVLDVDILRFQATKRISLKRVKPFEIKLVVNNNSSVSDIVDVTVTGTQNGTQVYNENANVEVNTGRSTIKFPRYTPDKFGNIEWTAEIIDQAPDVDTAKTTSKVVP